ncbi:MAG: hypothetical protein ABWZ98_09000 [Nakamurella sp.]
MAMPLIPLEVADDVLDSAPDDTDAAVAVADCSGVCPVVSAAADSDPALPVPLLQPAMSRVSAAATPPTLTTR